MENQEIKQALHEFHHEIDDGEDYEQFLNFTANRFNIVKKELAQSYEKYSKNLVKKQPKMK